MTKSESRLPLRTGPSKMKGIGVVHEREEIMLGSWVRRISNFLMTLRSQIPQACTADRSASH